MSEADLAVVADAKSDKTYLAGVPFTIYGSSLAVDNAGVTEYFELAAAELGAGADTSYGLGGARINHALGSMISSGTVPGLSAPVAGSVWPGVSARPGVVIIDTATNDNGHYPGNTTPAPLVGANGDRYLAAMKNMHEGALAVASSEVRIEQNAYSARTGTWVSATTTVAYGSGGTYTYTTTPGSDISFVIPAASIPQTGPLAGRCWLAHFEFEPAVLANANISYSIDGGPEIPWTKTQWEQYGTNTTVHAFTEFVLPTDGAAHTVKFTHIGSAGQYFSPDAIFCASPNPGPILVMAPAPVVVGSLWNATQVGYWNSNRQKIEPLVREAVAKFPNATYVPSTVTARRAQSQMACISLPVDSSSVPTMW